MHSNEGQINLDALAHQDIAHLLLVARFSLDDVPVLHNARINQRASDGDQASSAIPTLIGLQTRTF
jgi:hypothetical protein